MNINKALLSLSFLATACTAAVQIKECNVIHANAVHDSHTFTKMVQIEPFSLSASEPKIFSHEAYTLEVNLKAETQDYAIVELSLKENSKIVDEHTLVCAWDKKAHVKVGEKTESGESNLTFEVVVTR